MAVNRERLVFFERWFDPIAEEILNAEDDIELVRLLYAGTAEKNWSALATSCGYQVGARTELMPLDNVVATPHIAGATAETSREMSKAAAEQWIALLRGRVPPRLVNPEAWPRYAGRFERIIGFQPDPIGAA